jgi:hypothetical protein
MRPVERGVEGGWLDGTRPLTTGGARPLVGPFTSHERDAQHRRELA